MATSTQATTHPRRAQNACASRPPQGGEGPFTPPTAEPAHGPAGFCAAPHGPPERDPSLLGGPPGSNRRPAPTAQERAEGTILKIPTPEKTNQLVPPQVGQPQRHAQRAPGAIREGPRKGESLTQDPPCPPPIPGRPHLLPKDWPTAPFPVKTTGNANKEARRGGGTGQTPPSNTAKKGAAGAGRRRTQPSDHPTSLPEPAHQTTSPG
ncbi:hypothetical protein ACJJTC_010213 [Scirpophaga incertulas]